MRALQPGQRAELFVFDWATGASTLLLSSAELLFEAPNWSPDGRWLLVNGDGGLFRIDLEREAALEPVPLDGVPPLNNDHVIAPNGRSVFVSARDGHLYEVAWDGGTGRRVTSHGDGFKAYLHGISADGRTLAYIGGSSASGAWRTNVHTIGVDGSDARQVTDDDAEDDGAEFAPDGTIYVNSTRASRAPGHAQLFRLRDGAAEQLTFDERVNWFPHPSPDGSRLVYVSFPPGTLGHPADKPVELRALENGEPRTLVSLFGGQGTINVPSWSPDSTRFAYVAYPISGA